MDKKIIPIEPNWPQLFEFGKKMLNEEDIPDGKKAVIEELLNYGQRLHNDANCRIVPLAQQLKDKEKEQRKVDREVEAEHERKLAARSYEEIVEEARQIERGGQEVD